MAEKAISVTLVHGTFASKAAWVRKGPMTRALDAAGIGHQAFIWSGGNSHRARTKAAEELANRLRAEHKSGVRQAVVAHSHGGNVAAHAVWRLLGTDNGSIPVVALATPFLFAKRRSLHRLVLIAAAMWAFVALVVVTGFAAVVAVDGVEGDTSWWVLSFFVAAWTAIVVQLVCGAVWMRFHGRPWKRVDQDRLIERVQAPAPVGGGLLVIRAAEDEASTSLALAQLTGWLSASAARLSRPQTWTAIYGVLAAAGLALAALAEPNLEEAFFLALVLAINAAGLLSMVLVSAPALLSLSHGLDAPTTSLFAFVTAEATPPGQHVVIQRPIRDAAARGLSHSSLYDDPQVIAWVIDHVTS